MAIDNDKNREKKEESEFTKQEGTEETAIYDGNNQEKKEESEFTNQEGKDEIAIDGDNNQEKKEETESYCALVDIPMNSICVSDSDDLALHAALLHSISKDSPKEAVLDVKKRGKIDAFFPLLQTSSSISPSKRVCTGSGGEGLYKPSSSGYPECVICNDVKPVRDLIRSYCGHQFCEDCIKIYLGEKLNEDIFSVKCPEKNCERVLMDLLWSRYVPEEVFDRVEKARAECMVLADPQKFVCPECSGEFADDERGFLIRACTKCWRLLCTRCWHPWHMGMICDDL